MNDVSREAFEAWLQIEQFLDRVTIKETDFARRAWQASRKRALADAADFLVGLRNEPDMQFLATKIKELK